MATVFFSYSHKDEALRDQLEAHLAVLKNQGLVESWHDRRLVAGDEFDNSIMDNLEWANIILLLVSADFLSSPYCYSREMGRAMERHEAGDARVIPVILRHCLWQKAPFGKLLAAPRDGKPITSWPDIDEAMADVARMVADALQAPEIVTPQIQPSPPRISSAVAPERQTGVAPALARSSNLRLKKEFSEQERDAFLKATFEFVCRYFEGSIAALGERNPGVQGTFERIDSRRMAAVVYRGGKTIAECSVRIDGLGSRANGIAFSNDAAARHGSFNEMLSVAAGDYELHMNPMAMGWNSGAREARLSQEGTAEFLWGLFIQNAQ